MAGRRAFWLAAAVVAGAALLVFGRPFGTDSDPAGEDPTGSGPTAAGPAGAAPAATGPPVPQPGTGAPVPNRSASPSPTQVPTRPHDHRDGGLVGEETLAPGAAANARLAAEQFAAIWSTPDPRWHDRLARLATPDLAESLAGADPPRPVREITGPGEVLFQAPQWARVGVPADGGTVVLDVVAVRGEWLVSAVDWWPA